MQLTVDRIEGDFAVCEKPDRTHLNIPLADLPEGTSEGSVIILQDGVFTLDSDAEDQRRKKLFEMQNSLFSE